MKQLKFIARSGVNQIRSHAARSQRRMWLVVLALVMSAGSANHAAQAPSVALYAGTSGSGESAAEIYRLADNGVWQRQLSLSVPPGRSLRIEDFAFFKGRLYAATHSTSGSDFGRGLYSTLDGVNWVRDTTFGESDVFALSVVADQLYAGVFGGLYELRERSGRLIWTFVQFATANVNRVVAFGGKLYAGTHGEGLYVSAGSGGPWTQVAGFPIDGNVWAMMTFQNKLYIGTYDGQFYESADGRTWRRIPTLTAGQGCAHLVVFGQQMVAIAGDNCELFQSSDGTAWQHVAPGIGRVLALDVLQQPGLSRLYAGFSQSVRFTNDLMTWTELPVLPQGFLWTLGARPLPTE